MKHEINIGISGCTGTGKSTIAKIINNALISAGFENITLYDTEAIISNELLDIKTKSIKDRTKINIGTLQTMRASIKDL